MAGSPNLDPLPGSPRVTPGLSFSHSFGNAAPGNSDLVLLSFFHSLCSVTEQHCRVPTSRRWVYHVQQTHPGLSKQHAGRLCPGRMEKHRGGRRRAKAMQPVCTWDTSMQGTLSLSGPKQSSVLCLLLILQGLSSVFPSDGQKYLRSPRAFLVRLRTSRL